MAAKTKEATTPEKPSKASPDHPGRPLYEAYCKALATRESNPGFDALDGHHQAAWMAVHKAAQKAE